jgi:hypothetical protein
MQWKQIEDEPKIFALRERAPFRSLCLHGAATRLPRKECGR